MPEVLLVQRGPEQTVMTGMWELPALRESHVAAGQLRLTLRHAIMQVNYTVRIRRVLEEECDALTQPSNRRRWFRVVELETLALTGLARKVLLRSRLEELVAASQ